MTREMRIFFTLILSMLISLQVFAGDRELADLFAGNGVEGTMVIRSLSTGRSFIHNCRRARSRVSPASTFKIFNTLIALEEGAVSENENLLRWDGRHYEFPDWNRDQNLESAFRVSCVWYYREMARRVGAEKYRSYLQREGYGRLREPFDPTAFWLDGSLAVSPHEQVDFLGKVCRREMPFGASAYETLEKIMIAETNPRYTVRAKTGWASRVRPQVGWYVGYVESGADVWVFALNIDIRSEAELPLRKSLAFDALRLKGIIR